jgi:hypothetical protein
MKKVLMRTVVRQMCGLGLPYGVLIPSILSALREAIPCNSAMFALVDPHGRVTDLYPEGVTSPSAIFKHFDGYSDDPSEPACRRLNGTTSMSFEAATAFAFYNASDTNHKRSRRFAATSRTDR